MAPEKPTTAVLSSLSRGCGSGVTVSAIWISNPNIMRKTSITVASARSIFAWERNCAAPYRSSKIVEPHIKFSSLKCQIGCDLLQTAAIQLSRGKQRPDIVLDVLNRERLADEPARARQNR